MKPNRLKFRQRVDGRWHYWGFVGGGEFVAPASLSADNQQFTGLLDINGKEIYEDDIVRRHLEPDAESDYGVKHGEPVEGAIAVVRWDDRFAEFRFRLFRGYYWSFHGPDGDVYWHPSEKRLEVIGNIYENPDLLGVD